MSEEERWGEEPSDEEDASTNSVYLQHPLTEPQQDSSGEYPTDPSEDGTPPPGEYVQTSFHHLQSLIVFSARRYLRLWVILEARPSLLKRRHSSK